MELADENGNELTIRSTRSASSYVLQGFPGSRPVRVRAGRPDVQAWDARAAGWKPFLRLGRRRERATASTSPSPLWRSVDVRVRAACQVGRPDRPRLRDALALAALKPVADAGVERLVFAPGIGLVEVVVQTIAGPRSYGSAAARSAGRSPRAARGAGGAGAPRSSCVCQRAAPPFAGEHDARRPRGSFASFRIARGDGHVVDVPAVDAVQPSMPKSNRRRIVSPGLTPTRAEVDCDWPQLPVTSPPSVPLNAGWPASGFVFPPRRSRGSAL